MAAVHPTTPLVEKKALLRVRRAPPVTSQPHAPDPRWDDPFLVNIDEAVAQADPRVAREVRMLAQLGLVLEAERVLIDYLVHKHAVYEIVAAEAGYADSFRAENTLMHKVTTALSECSTLSTLAACLAWVSLGK